MRKGFAGKFIGIYVYEGIGRNLHRTTVYFTVNFKKRLMEQLWETDSFVDENTLSVNVGRLRKRLDAAGLENFITTKFGVGYLIEN